MRPIPIFISFVAGLLLLPLAGYLYLAFGHPPVATADKPLPLESRIVSIPLRARSIDPSPVTLFARYTSPARRIQSGFSP